MFEKRIETLEKMLQIINSNKLVHSRDPRYHSNGNSCIFGHFISPGEVSAGIKQLLNLNVGLHEGLDPTITAFIDYGLMNPQEKFGLTREECSYIQRIHDNDAAYSLTFSSLNNYVVCLLNNTLKDQNRVMADQLILASKENQLEEIKI